MVYLHFTPAAPLYKFPWPGLFPTALSFTCGSQPSDPVPPSCSRAMRWSCGRQPPSTPTMPQNQNEEGHEAREDCRGGVLATGKNNKAHAPFSYSQISALSSNPVPALNRIPPQTRGSAMSAQFISSEQPAQPVLSEWVLFLNHLFWEMSLLSLGGWNTHTRHPTALPGMGKAAVAPAQWCSLGMACCWWEIQKPAPPAPWAQQPGQGTVTNSCNYCQHENCLQVSLFKNDSESWWELQHFHTDFNCILASLKLIFICSNSKMFLPPNWGWTQICLLVNTDLATS